MLKFNYAINLGLATLLVVPAVTLGTNQNESLEVTLKKTVEALDELAAIEQRLHDKDPGAIHDALRWTEAPLQTPDNRPEVRDELLVGLRDEVARLQREAEALESGSQAVELKTPEIPAESAREIVESTVDGPTTIGLDDAARRKLSSKPRVAPPSDAGATTAGATAPTKPASSTNGGKTPAKQSFEPEGFAADAFKLGRAFYRQGRYDQALVNFEGNAKNPEAQYWRARCLEKLGRTADAIVAYGQVSALPDAGFAAERAKEDLEFLQWRLEFDKSRPKTEGTKP
ncbi:MAG: tetratricopeptide repeat protein [Planctomycetes bacterium]|nr:tetratricopeptide repeat protein [Planctomycetota bacterium]